MLIERHASWIALNNIVGCPNNCKYCFLQERSCRPKIISNPMQAVEQLIKSDKYKEDIPICLMPNTDAFATLSNKRQLFLVCNMLKRKRIKNLIVIITKREINDRDCLFIKGLRNKGLNICVYVSYSGLDEQFEKGVRKNNQLEVISSMKNLKRYNIPCIHYWRPLLPQNTNIEILKTVLNTVRKYCFASCMTGLKLYPDMSCKEYWPEVQNLFDKGVNPECFVPKMAFDNIIKLAKEVRYRVFIDNVCLLASLQKKACEYGNYQSYRCNKYNMCSNEQRLICGKFYHFEKPEQVCLENNISMDVLLDMLQKQKMSALNQKMKNTTYWQNSFTSDKWIEL